MQKRAQFDDRIRNLITLAQDGSKHSRSLLFSHISDLFLQARPMESDHQIRMLCDILKELLDQVDQTVRQDIVTTLCAMPAPPEPLINIMCEDRVEISGPLLEKAILPDERLIHIIRYGTEAHRIHISRRFGLSPLVRHALDKAHHQDEHRTRLKVSLSTLHQQAKDNRIPDIDEETTRNILEMLRAQNIHNQTVHDFPGKNTSKSESLPTTPPLYLKETGADVSPTNSPANDALHPPSQATSSVIRMRQSPSDMFDDLNQDAQDAQNSMRKQRDLAKTIADWFWETDRVGRLTFLSEEAFTVFGSKTPDMITQDFISLCHPKHPDQENFVSLFERRSAFRHKAFYMADDANEKKLWYLSAVPVFDPQNGRFAGFRGSAQSEITAHPRTTSQKPVAHPTSGNGSTEKETSPPNETVAAELLQNLSHEFRTPLNAIIGFSEMIQMEAMGPINKQYHDNLKNILTAAFHLKEAVNDVLDSAKIESGLMEIDPESFSLKTVLRDCYKNIEPMIEEYHIQLMDYDNNIDVILYNDRQSVELCLTKILASSIRRAQGGEVLSPSVMINSSAQVRIEIPLLGSRITPQDGDKIFKKLEQEPNSKAINLEKYPGKIREYESKIASGFGLSIAQKLAEMIGGTISLHSNQEFVTHLVLTLNNHDLDG